ncbi:hypothetical protein POJ06DRAFT_241933 [Lipomyces tetrasporus]|uniref:DUF2415 domain-containing protein n=1 Tax=Lipomyces tetrasporus TaxID=54092 RepID=A0AAD7QXV4_9ASCO|nr:uncharacterized protein POJ06DRAFT_241933 [Lipomyces tetrasporus]KAJ8103455.1 hypothetical protein POJ06DRAFT_241933 [Lipomyces tetrasporus]
MTIETGDSTSRRTSTFVDANSFVSHPARVTIKHWQLRDLICKTANPHEVLFVSERVVKSIDTDTGKTAQCAEFAFEPRCLSSAYGIIAAGGVQRGQLGITYRRPEEDADDGVCLPVTMIELGGYINNSITLFKPGAASVSALVCNNDHTLRMLDINGSSYTVVDTLQLPVPLNHASISPDRKSIIACGDSAHLFLFHPEERQRSNEASNESARVDSLTSLKWTQTATLATSADAGFSTAFAPSGVLFAVASQDGLASVYDSRYVSTSTSHTSLSTRNAPKPMKYIESTRPHENAGAFRCLKFSTGAEDLLLISEQTGRVHVVDTRRFEDRQILDIPSTVNYRTRTIRRRRDNPGNDSSSSPGGAAGPSSGHSESSAYSRRRRLIGMASSRITAEVQHQRTGGSSYIPPYPTDYVTHDETGEIRRRGNDFSSDSALAGYYYQTHDSRRGSERSQEGYNDDNDDVELDDDEELDEDERYCVFGDVAVSRSASSSSSNITGRITNSMDPAARLIREKEISGIAWSDEERGSIIVGWDSGIGKWTVDRWGRRVFPSYKMR